MACLLFSLCVLPLSGAAAWASRRESIGLAGAVAGSLAGLAAAVSSLLSGGACALNLPWRVPYGALHLEIDPLSAFFLLPIFLVSGLCAVYAGEYLRPFRGAKPLGRCWFFYNALLASMALVVAA
jgi:NADH:ubiquinone oxidoreductase subunit 5 (subunit L)/multisubunit Na+/H+ antiporter MnhA subunit